VRSESFRWEIAVRSKIAALAIEKLEILLRRGATRRKRSGSAHATIPPGGKEKLPWDIFRKTKVARYARM